MHLFHGFNWVWCCVNILWQKEKSAWQIKDGCGEATGIYSKLSQCQTIVDDEDLKTLDKFLVMVYDRSSTAECVDDVRLDMFAPKQWPYEVIPLTVGTQKQHVKRGAYQLTASGVSQK